MRLLTQETQLVTLGPPKKWSRQLLAITGILKHRMKERVSSERGGGLERELELCLSLFGSPVSLGLGFQCRRCEGQQQRLSKIRAAPREAGTPEDPRLCVGTHPTAGLLATSPVLWTKKIASHLDIVLLKWRKPRAREHFGTSQT